VAETTADFQKIRQNIRPRKTADFSEGSAELGWRVADFQSASADFRSQPAENLLPISPPPNCTYLFAGYLPPHSDVTRGCRFVYGALAIKKRPRFQSRCARCASVSFGVWPKIIGRPTTILGGRKKKGGGRKNILGCRKGGGKGPKKKTVDFQKKERPMKSRPC